MRKVCVICGKELNGRQIKYCSIKCLKKNKWIKRNSVRRERTKKFRLNYKKNKSCILCGWNKHTEILQFHHKEKSDKIKRSISHMLTWKQLKKEISKCVLLCPNCHFWLHYEDYQLRKLD